MTWGFQNLPAVISTTDGRNGILLQPLEYLAKDGTRYRAAAGTRTDGMSTPPEVWAIIPPFGPTTWAPAVLHDSAYRVTLEICLDPGGWHRTALPRDACDLFILEAMESLGGDPLLRTVIYEALKQFGQAAFDSDRNLK